jgi:hypothetical protein
MMRGWSRRGQPLVALVMVLGGWVSARAMMWDPGGLPSVLPPVWSPLAPVEIAAKTRQPSATLVYRTGHVDAVPYSFANQSYPGQLPTSTFAPTPLMIQAPTIEAAFIEPPRVARQIVLPLSGPVNLRVAPAIAANRQFLWTASLSQISMPSLLLRMPDPAPAPVLFTPAGLQPHGIGKRGTNPLTNRWAIDSWVLWRRGSNGAPFGGLLTPSYGASQAGAVLRFRLAPGSSLRPAIYLRTTAALNGSDEREAALGLSLRPLSLLPISLLGEARYTTAPGGHALRPAVLVVTGLPPVALPLGLRGEAYGQAGYVGGRFATGFADGQLRLDHRVVELGKADVRFGGGAWGGIQKGASRVDAGPTLTVGQPLGGPASIRLGADWRFRVAGKAAPGSGPAVTLSAGF